MYIVLFSSIFVLDVGFNTSLLFTRFMRFAFIPASIVLAYFHEIGYRKQSVKRTYKLAFCASVLTISYIVYAQYVNS